MAIKKKRAPAFTDIDSMSRVIDAIYDDINDLINSVNSLSTESRALSGKKGDIRVIQDKGNASYRLEAYTEDGWAKTDLTIVKE
tara:strand:+ start:2567 stop:2818 length:252 start_codon:yes stop_codon:yes gene_type:complete